MKPVPSPGWRRIRRLSTAVLVTSTFSSASPAAAPSAESTPRHTSPSAKRGPSLREVLAATLAGSPDLRVARAVHEVTRSALVAARLSSLGNPEIELVAERGRRVTRDVTLTGALWLPLEVGGQRGRRIAEAESLIAHGNAWLAEARASALAETTRAFGLAVVSGERLRILDEIAAHARAESDVLGARADGGDATQRDVKLAEVETGRYQVLIDETRADLESALSRLALSTGQSYGEPLGAELEPPALSARVLAARVAGAPGVQSARTEAAFHGRVVERAAREGAGPVRVGVIGGRGDLGELRLGAGIAYAVPVSRSLQGEQARARAEQRRALTEAEARRQQIELRLQGVLRETVHVRRAVRALEQRSLPAARLALDAAVELQRAGKGDVLAVIVSRRQLAELQLLRLDLAARGWELLGEVVQLTGVTP